MSRLRQTVRLIIGAAGLVLFYGATAFETWARDLTVECVARHTGRMSKTKTGGARKLNFGIDKRRTGDQRIRKIRTGGIPSKDA